MIEAITNALLFLWYLAIIIAFLTACVWFISKPFR